MFRLNVEGQLTSGEWCGNVDNSAAINVQWCNMGSVDGPWEYRPELKQVVDPFNQSNVLVIYIYYCEFY